MLSCRQLQIRNHFRVLRSALPPPPPPPSPSSGPAWVLFSGSFQVLQCQTDGREAGSLFSILDRTQTACGRRVLAGWVRQPLLSPEVITARQVR